MIIVCVNCNKKFNVDSNLIPENGREIQCGSCNHIWHYKIEKPILETFVPDEKIAQEEREVINEDQSNNIKPEYEPKEKNNLSSPLNFFSYLIVFIISVIALIIFVDTIKSPLIDIFPSVEIILFNLFETLKDIKLFIIDLT